MASQSPWIPDIIRCIHNGGNSVYHLEYFQKNPNRPRVLAMKEVDAESGTGEVNAMQSIYSLHEAFVRLYHHERSGSKVNLYMEFADFGSADNLILSLQLYSKFYSQSEILHIAYNLTGALLAMHEQGWAHRDLKPRNLFMFLNGTIKIGDFGVAKRVLDPTGLHSVQGTEAFMSPNLNSGLQGDMKSVRTNPFKDDVYALGSSLFSIASYQQLSEMGTANEASDNLFKGFIKASLERYSEEVQDLLYEMVHYNENTRLTALEAHLKVLGMLSIVPRYRGCSYCGADILAVLECGHRLCSMCFSKLIASQLGAARGLTDFQCSQCNGRVGATVVNAYNRVLGPEVRSRLLTIENLHAKKRLRLCIA